MGDLISRSKLHTTILRQPHRVIDDREYVSRDAVLAKIRMAPSVDAVEVVRCVADERVPELWEALHEAQKVLDGWFDETEED